MKEIKVSIVIPIYNAKKYLSSCLDSVINQSYENIEIVLIDDGSSDGSDKICDSYAKNDKRIVVYHQKNAGVSCARNNGINNSHGEYICFIDADDIIHSDYVKKLINYHDENTLTVCQIDRFYDTVLFPANYNEEETELDKDHFVELCKMSLLNTPCCKLYNAKIIKDNNILFDSKLSLGEDLIFNLNYLKYIDRIKVINQKLYYYRKGEKNTLSSSYNPNMFEIQLLLFDSYTEFFEGKILDEDMLCVFDSFRFGFILEIIDNEYANGNIGFWQRYLKARKVVKNDKIQERISKIHHLNKKTDYFLLKHKLVLIYKLMKKIRGTIS